MSIISLSSWQEHKHREVGLTHHPASRAATLAGAAPGAGSRPKPALLPAAPGRGRAFFPPSPRPPSAPGRKEGEVKQQQLQRPGSARLNWRLVQTLEGPQALVLPHLLPQQQQPQWKDERARGREEQRGVNVEEMSEGRRGGGGGGAVINFLFFFFKGWLLV